ncbi:MAG: crossover junction endodeoxyribonuclease RuvC [Sphaerochaetaceae bacterium]|nr:crossover junction endodeoxyribonuclease RuvC [Sphaerochaetaceae bacterium]
MIILGIDPGIANTGWGVIDCEGQRFRPVSYGTINTSVDEKSETRIAQIGKNVGLLIEKYKVDVISMEDIFFAKNEKSAIGVAKVIGSIIMRASQLNVNVTLFTPLQIKLAITGYGKAEKKQIQEMVRLLLKLDKIPRPDHAADALSAAVCYAHTNSSLTVIKGGLK